MIKYLNDKEVIEEALKDFLCKILSDEEIEIIAEGIIQRLTEAWIYRSTTISGNFKIMLDREGQNANQ